MADVGSRPLVSSSVLRKIRAGQFAQKKPLGTQTTEAVVGASLEQQAQEKRHEASLASDRNIAEKRRQQEQRNLDIAQEERTDARRRQEKSDQLATAASIFSGLMGS